MLTAAICGDVFASPPVDSILAVCILQILLIYDVILLSLWIKLPIWSFLSWFLIFFFSVSGHPSCDWFSRVPSDSHGISIFELKSNYVFWAYIYFCYLYICMCVCYIFPVIFLKCRNQTAYSLFLCWICVKWHVNFPMKPRFVSWQNYTGDRLNFGLAAEQAKSEGYKVEVWLLSEYK